jgi:hypothetical protein
MMLEFHVIDNLFRLFENYNDVHLTTMDQEAVGLHIGTYQNRRKLSLEHL